MLLSIAQADYPGWRATVDDRPVKIWRANYGFQAFEVPAGRHGVRVVFRSRSFELGVIVGALGLLAAAAADFALRRNQVYT